MGRVIHFEIHSADPEKACAFYSALFGWTTTAWDGPAPYWLVSTGDPEAPGIDGGIMMRQGDPPVKGQAVSSFVCTVAVDDLDASLAKADELGATLAVPRMAVPGVGWMAYITDPDGNILGLMQMDPGAQ